MEPVILEVIADGATYGYEIARAIEKASERAHCSPRKGTLYPALHRLEKQGLLAAQWAASPEGRQRKHYQLTPLGPQAAAGIAEGMDERLAAPPCRNLILGIENVQAQLAW